MIDGRRVIVVFLARQGSERVINKNMKPLLGKPLYSWTMDQIYKSKYVDMIVLSSYQELFDDFDGRYYSKDIDVIKHRRTNAENGSELTQFDSVRNALKVVDAKDTDIIVQMDASKPLGSAKNIDMAVEEVGIHGNNVCFTGKKAGVSYLRKDSSGIWKIVDKQNLIENFGYARVRDTHIIKNPENKTWGYGGKKQFLACIEDYEIDINTNLDFALAERTMELL